MNLDIAYVSEPGERSNNEDCVDVITTDFGTCTVLCDGLGGHADGELASACVCASIRKYFQAVTDSEDIHQLVYDLILKAQNDLLQHQIEYGKTDGMKTTCCCLIIRERQAAAAYVGDSRIYFIRKNKLNIRSKDHSIPQYLVNMGEIREKDIRHHPDRNKLLRVMGSEWESPRHQCIELPKLSDKDAFLLWSDGFWEWIEEKEMLLSLRNSSDSRGWLEQMKDLVYKYGCGKHMDNLSAITVKCRK